MLWLESSSPFNYLAHHANNNTCSQEAPYQSEDTANDCYPTNIRLKQNHRLQISAKSSRQKNQKNVRDKNIQHKRQDSESNCLCTRRALCMVRLPIPDATERSHDQKNVQQRNQHHEGIDEPHVRKFVTRNDFLIKQHSQNTAWKS